MVGRRAAMFHVEHQGYFFGPEEGFLEGCGL